MRSSITEELEQGTHFVYEEQDISDGLVQDVSQIYVGYQKNKKRYHRNRNPVFDRITENQYRLLTHLLSRQNGTDEHGFLVLLGLKILADEMNLYPSIEDAEEQVTVEGRMSGLRPDILDEENKIVVECGWINSQTETEVEFVDKCTSYVHGGITVRDDFAEYTFLHIPKSSVRRKIVETGVVKYTVVGAYRTVMFRERLEELVDDGVIEVFNH